MEDFIACYSEVSDPRQENVRHNLHEVLIIALCTLLCGGEDCSDIEVFGRAKRAFLRQFLRLKHGIPSHDTFSRVFRQLDPKPFQACFVRFMERPSVPMMMRHRPPGSLPLRALKDHRLNARVFSPTTD